MKKKIFFYMILLSLATIILTTAIMTYYMNDRINLSLQQQIQTALDLTVSINEAEVFDRLAEQKLQLPTRVDRVTLFNPDGVVLYDSNVSATIGKDKMSRTEFQNARKYGKGEDRRVSETTGFDSYYYARLLDNGNVLRFSTRFEGYKAHFQSTMPYLTLMSVIVFMISVLLADWLSLRVLEPLETFDHERPYESHVYDEMAPFVARIAEQQRNLINLNQLSKQKQQEFNYVFDNMQEGVVILDGSGNILLINQSAEKTFGVEIRDYEGVHIYALYRSHAFQIVVDKALRGESIVSDVEIHNRYYQLISNPVMKDTKVCGLVMLILDLTEKMNSDKMRREFTANVSHELKTPLTSIRGYAELIKDGIAREKDVPNFAGRIYAEADRMLIMVNDIISLSHLDEGKATCAREPVDLHALALDVIDRLRLAASDHEVELFSEGESVEVVGYPMVLDELVYNLVENGIKYNRPGGKVTVTTTTRDGKTTLIVADTGIGIKKEDQNRVFERFYRVDKSHSRETGGTGLGLSIVKHAAHVHQATIDLESRPHVGTTITLTFEP